MEAMPVGLKDVNQVLKPSIHRHHKGIAHSSQAASGRGSTSPFGMGRLSPKERNGAAAILMNS
jgi:hypothetical protein